jgi:hypothetical protein
MRWTAIDTYGTIEAEEPLHYQLVMSRDSRWRGQNEDQFNSYRLPIIKFIQQRCASGKASSMYSPQEMLRSKGHAMSPNKFSKVLKEAAGTTYCIQAYISGSSCITGIL